MKLAVDDTKRESLVFDVISTWRGGALPDARQFLDQHPELWSDKEVVLDLAAEEYALRRKAGEDITPSRFCERFPSVRASLMRLVLVGEMISRSPLIHRTIDDSVWPRPGQDFLGFRIVRQLGRGAFARVYLADEAELGGRRVVIKVAQFAGREAEILGKLNHPNVVPVFSVKSHRDYCLTAVCMPYLGEATLTDVLEGAFTQSGKLPTSAEVILRAARVNPKSELQAREPAHLLRRGTYVEGVTYLGVRIAQALVYTHGRSILHRDLKPSNVLVQPNGEPVLLDFNLSTDSEKDLVRAGGTIPYMAPEQLYAVFLEPNVHAATDDPRSDIFALGVILYQLLSGRLPFQEPSMGIPDQEAAEAMLKYQRKKPVDLSALNPSVDRPLAQLVARCLEFDPESRPQSAAEVVQVLNRRLSTSRRVVSRVRQHWLISSLALLLVVGALSAFSVKMATRPAYPEREFQRGVAAVHDGNFAVAAEHLDSARKSGANSQYFYRALGLTHARLSEWELAAKYFEEAHKVETDAVTCAWIGYCRSRGTLFAPGIYWYTQATKLGYAPEWVHVNTGHSFRTIAQYYPAKQSLLKALELNPKNDNTILCLLEVANSSKVVPYPEAREWALKGAALYPLEPLFPFYVALFSLPREGKVESIPPEVQRYIDHALELGLERHKLRLFEYRMGASINGAKNPPLILGDRSRHERKVLMEPTDLPDLAGPARIEPLAGKDRVR